MATEGGPAPADVAPRALGPDALRLDPGLEHSCLTQVITYTESVYFLTVALGFTAGWTQVFANLAFGAPHRTPAHTPTPGDPQGPQRLNVPHFIDKEMRIGELELLPLDEPLAGSGERHLTPRPFQNRRGLFLQVARAWPVL